MPSSPVAALSPIAVERGHFSASTSPAPRAVRSLPSGISTEHKMIIHDLWSEYGIGDEAINAHCDALAQHLQDYSPESLKEAFQNCKSDEAGGQPLRVCIAANGFEVGGGEILPVELANALKGRGLHVTYLVIERPGESLDGNIRKRLRSDIPVVYWDDICDDFSGFIEKYGIQLINSHNVSVDFRFFLRNISFQIPYVASLHGGYETVPDLLTPDFTQYLSTTVKKWLYLAERNFAFLSSYDRRRPQFRSRVSMRSQPIKESGSIGTSSERNMRSLPRRLYLSCARGRSKPKDGGGRSKSRNGFRRCPSGQSILS